VHFHCSCLTWLLSFHFIMFVSYISKCTVGGGFFFFFFFNLAVNSSGIRIHSVCGICMLLPFAP